MQNKLEIIDYKENELYKEHITYLSPTIPIYKLNGNYPIDRLAKSFHINERMLNKLKKDKEVLFYDEIPYDNVGYLVMILESLKDKGIECFAYQNWLIENEWQYGFNFVDNSYKHIYSNGWIIKKHSK